MEGSKDQRQRALEELGARMETIADELWEKRAVTEYKSFYDLTDIVALLRGFNRRVKEKKEYK